MSAAVREVGLALGCVGLCFVPGIIGSRFQPGAWYDGLVKPALTPPGWVFPVAWTLLYVLMGIALFLVVRRPQAVSGVSVAVAVFAVQLVLNGVWSWLFFGLQRPGLALLELVVLWCTILTATIMFWRISVAAGVLLLPYLAWVGFASWLNLGLWRLNSGG